MPVRVLMIDDSVFVRDVLRHHLECIGCEVVAEAENTSTGAGSLSHRQAVAGNDGCCHTAHWRDRLTGPF